MGIKVDGEQSLFFLKISEGVWYRAYVSIQAAKPRAGSLQTPVRMKPRQSLFSLVLVPAKHPSNSHISHSHTEQKRGYSQSSFNGVQQLKFTIHVSNEISSIVTCHHCFIRHVLHWRAVADPDLQLRGGGQFKKQFFSALRASVWFKKRGHREPSPVSTTQSRLNCWIPCHFNTTPKNRWIRGYADARKLSHYVTEYPLYHYVSAYPRIHLVNIL